MAWVETRITRTTQPQDAVPIDWNNPLAKGLISAVSPFGDAVTNKAFQRQGTLVIAANATGRAVVGNGSSYIKSTIAPEVFTKPEVTLFYVGSVAPVNTSVAASVTGSGGNQLLTFIFDASSYQNVVYRATNGGGSITRLYDVFNPVGVFKWGATYDGTSNLKIYNNGFAVTTNGTVGTLNNATPSGFDSVCLGGADRSSDLFQGSGGEANVAYAWNRALSAAEHKLLSDNPWQIYEPEVQRIWVDDYVSAGGGATVIPIGVQATGSVGTPSATGAATTTPAGVSASSAVGTPVAVGGASLPATVLPAGVQATSAIGAVSATGAAVAQPVGVVASSAVGTPVAIGEAAGVTVVYPAGVQAVAAVGTPGVIAAARVIPIGVQAMGEVGEPLAYAGDTPPVVASSNYGFEMSAGKRYYVKRKGKILLFDSAEQADDYLSTEQQATVVTSRGAKKRIAAKLVKVAPIETIELEPVTELLSRYMPDVSLPNLLKMRDIEQVLKMQQQALLMQDDEDIELLLMTL